LTRATSKGEERPTIRPHYRKARQHRLWRKDKLGTKGTPVDAGLSAADLL
jgi:hypothetical protein